MGTEKNYHRSMNSKGELGSVGPHNNHTSILEWRRQTRLDFSYKTMVGAASCRLFSKQISLRYGLGEQHGYKQSPPLIVP